MSAFQSPTFNVTKCRGKESLLSVGNIYMLQLYCFFVVSPDKYIGKCRLFVLRTLPFTQLMKYFIAIVKWVLVCPSNIPRTSLEMGMYQNCHLVIKGSFWFFLVFFLVLFSSVFGSLVLFQFLYQFFKFCQDYKDLKIRVL